MLDISFYVSNFYKSCNYEYSLISKMTLTSFEFYHANQRYQNRMIFLLSSPNCIIYPTRIHHLNEVYQIKLRIMYIYPKSNLSKTSPTWKKNVESWFFQEWFFIYSSLWNHKDPKDPSHGFWIIDWNPIWRRSSWLVTGCDVEKILSGLYLWILLFRSPLEQDRLKMTN